MRINTAHFVSWLTIASLIGMVASVAMGSGSRTFLFDPSTGQFYPTGGSNSVNYRDSVTVAVFANPNFLTANISLQNKTFNTAPPSDVESKLSDATAQASLKASAPILPGDFGTDLTNFNTAVNDLGSDASTYGKAVLGLLQAADPSDPTRALYSGSQIVRSTNEYYSQYEDANTGALTIDMDLAETDLKKLTDAYNALNPTTPGDVLSYNGAIKNYGAAMGNLTVIQEQVADIRDLSALEVSATSVQATGQEVDVTITTTKVPQSSSPGKSTEDVNPQDSEVAGPSQTTIITPQPLTVGGVAPAGGSEDLGSAVPPTPSSSTTSRPSGTTAAPGAPTPAAATGNTTNGPYNFTIPVIGDPQPTFSTGLMFSGLVDPSYGTRVDPTSGKSYITQTKDSFATTVAEFIHTPLGSGGPDYTTDFSLGLGTNGSETEYGIGLTLACGVNQRSLITVGVLGAQVSRLPNGLSVGDPVPTSGPSATPALPSASKVFRTGLFVALSYNFGS
jgi:hypothetical protein